jgi:hypothetical protein
VRGDDVELGEARPDDLEDAPLVHAVAVGVQQADGNRVSAAAPRLLDRGNDRCLVERRVDRAIGAQALAYLEHPLARHQWCRTAIEQVDRLLQAEPRDTEDVAVAFRRQERDRRLGAFDRRVRADRRAVDDEQRVVATYTVPLNDALDSLNDGAGIVRARRGELVAVDLGISVRLPAPDGEVGEGPADIDADPEHVLSFLSC